jgi:ubiquinone/menaquinone biosynthesis C-methylase UbiE
MPLLDRVRASLYDRTMRRFERRHGAALRRRVLARAHGRVLEIGGGTGANLEHYPDGVDEVVFTEPNEAMLARARRRGFRATFVQAGAEALPFEDGSFDAAVATLVLCTVPDEAAALRELRRVVKPGGELLFAEHVRSDDPRRAKWQDRLERPWRVFADGCHPNRETVAALEAAGFAVEVDERGELPCVPRLVRPYVAGRAVASA